jgi:hypothetical protein
MPCPKCDECPMALKYGIPIFEPDKAVEGDAMSPIWVVGINPKTKPERHKPGKPNPITWRPEDTNWSAPHFRRLGQVLGEDWYQLLKSGGIAHTDLLKCGSPGVTDVENRAVSHCRSFLIHQVRKYRPKLLLIVSSAASRFIAEAANLPSGSTEGDWQFGSKSYEKCYVLLSGYTGPRQDRYAKRRLNSDFLAACIRLSLKPLNRMEAAICRRAAAP